MTTTTRRKRPSRLPNTVSTYVPDETYQNLAVICTERNISLSEFVRDALNFYLANVA